MACAVSFHEVSAEASLTVDECFLMAAHAIGPLGTLLGDRQLLNTQVAVTVSFIVMVNVNQPSHLTHTEIKGIYFFEGLFLLVLLIQSEMLRKGRKPLGGWALLRKLAQG